MKVLLLHPKDADPPPGQWDLVVDLERAPAATYERWGQSLRCPIISFYTFCEPIEDLYRLRTLFQTGLGFVVDACGIDWWDVLPLLNYRALFDVLQAGRMARHIGPRCELFASRPDPRVSALESFFGIKANIINKASGGLIDRARHYADVVSRFDATRLFHIFQDKFDSRHRLRSWLAPPVRGLAEPVVLLPSPYINVSRTAVSFASLLPEQQFLLMITRPNGKLASLPANVCMQSLDSYFVPENNAEFETLRNRWEEMKSHLLSSSDDFRAADAAGILAGARGLLRWGLAVRDAWSKVFASQHVTACLCADDFNPYSRIPVLLAKQKGLPSVVCHHGALGAALAFKPHEADFYLAKGQMEFDYFVRVCRIPPGKVVLGGPAEVPLASTSGSDSTRPWMVFFTEPYDLLTWRKHEVYRDLLPRLCQLAESCKLKLVFKLHPFESPKGHRKLLASLLPAHQLREIEVISGPPTPELWQNARLALTVQSTVALECTMLGVPVFLCAWLQMPYGGYVSQFSRFAIGQILESPSDLASLPLRLANYHVPEGIRANLVSPIAPSALRSLLTGHRLPADGPPGANSSANSGASSEEASQASSLSALATHPPHSN